MDSVKSFDFDDDEAFEEPKLTTKLVLKSKNSKRGLPVTPEKFSSSKKLRFKYDINDRKVGYIFSPSLLGHVNRIPKVKKRAAMVHELIQAYGLLNNPNLSIISSIKASKNQLLFFHTESYLKKLELTESETFKDADDCNLDESSSFEEFGLAYDCPVMSQMLSFVQEVAGSTLTALKALDCGHVSIAINWFGGWHHAKKDEASGFCYVNDIVIGILWLLQQGYRRVFYVDFDLHHGDAVEDAFAHTDKVFTLSLHKFESGFFPGTGDFEDIGNGIGTGYSLNIPFKDGIRDENYIPIATKTLKDVLSFYKPEIIVSQFGADCITGDPMTGFSLTPESMKQCLNVLVESNLPLLVLGGGGYNPVNVARTWTSLTSQILKINLDSNIPDNSYFLSYGPGYDLDIQPGTKKDQNDADFLNSVSKFVDSQLNDDFE